MSDLKLTDTTGNKKRVVRRVSSVYMVILSTFIA